MNPQDIEENIKSLLGLNIGGDGGSGLAPGEGQPRFIVGGAGAGGGGGGGAPVFGGAVGPIFGPQGMDPGTSGAHRASGGGVINTEDSSPPAIIPPVLRAEMEAEREFIDECAAEAQYSGQEDWRPSVATIQYLETRHLYPLKNKSSKFPRARWFCRLCEYHCDNLQKCREHFSDTRHSRLARSKEVETTLYHLPRPTKHHIDCLDGLLASLERDYGLDQSDLQARKIVASHVHGLLQARLPGCEVRLYGSSLSGFGLRSANCNLDLQISSDQKPHLVLLTTLEILQQSPDYIQVMEEFTAKIPLIKFRTMSGLSCELSLNNHQAYQTSQLLADYWGLDPRVRTLGAAFRFWANLVRLDRQAEGTLPPHTFAILLVYFLQQQTKPVLPCIHEWLDHRDDDTYIAPHERLAGWRTQNKMTPAELWIGLFAFLSIGFKSAELVVSLRKAGATTNEDKQWKTKKLAVEDPYSFKRNLCRSIQAVSVYDYISDCLKTGYLYFGTIQTSLGPVITRIIVKNKEEVEKEEEVCLADWSLESWLAVKGSVLTEKEAASATALVPRNMLAFRFDQAVLTNGSVPAIQCLVCGVEGHLHSTCPDEQLPPLVTLPPMTREFLGIIDNLCKNVEQDWQPQEPELRDRDYIMSDLNRYIKKFWPKAELTVFGSSSNGFAFRHSDLDISLTFRDIPTSENLDSIKIIEELSERVKRMVGMRNVVAITSAKVPIVKLIHQQCQIEADLSLYNVLARENTCLLALYSDLDPRVRTLGYMVKLFAKVCDIGDASRGSLSSYAYILMMIFYLQHCSPPLVPVLQEIYPPGEEKPVRMVDGWNAWFYSDRRKVMAEWPGFNKNRQSVGQLWLGFLNFYAGDWDDKRLVVSIRQFRPLTKFEKMWNSPCIAIEDPFELSHNLGAGISRKMNLYIKKALINGRRVFGTPLSHNPRGYRTVQDYFFDPDLLTDGAPPNDRGCRACGKIGHLVADCPRKKDSDNRKRREKDRRERQGQGQGQGVQEGRVRTHSEQGGIPGGHTLHTGNRHQTEPRRRTKTEMSGEGAGERSEGGPPPVGPVKPPPGGPWTQTSNGTHEGPHSAPVTRGSSLPRGAGHEGNPQEECTPGIGVPSTPLQHHHHSVGPLPYGSPVLPFPGSPVGRPYLPLGPQHPPIGHRPPPPSNDRGQFDVGAFAALAGLGPRLPGRVNQDSGGPVFPLCADLGGTEVPSGPTVAGAINAEDLEASFLTERREPQPALAPGPGPGPVPAPGPGPGGPPPGFGGAPLLGQILSQLGPPVRPPVQSLEQIQMMQRHLQSLRLTPNGFLGGPTGQDPHVGPLPNLGPPHRHPSGDPLGIQSLANLGPPGSTPMMMPMMPFGLPPMGLLPFSNPSPGIHFPPSISPPPPAAHSPILGSPPSSSSLATWPSSQPTMFGSLTGPVAPFNTRDTGFPSSVLFPGDLHHPLLSPGSPTQTSLPQPGLPSAMKPSSPDPDLASGSPVTPPNLGLHTFNFED